MNLSEKMHGTGLKIGRHFSPGGKHIMTALAEAIEEPASAIQVFGGNPHHYWCSSSAPEKFGDKFKELKGDIWSVVHACYLTNVGAPPEDRGHRMTLNSLVNHLEWAEAFGIEAVVFHPGSPKDKPRDDALEWALQGLREVMVRYEGPVNLLLENAANDKKIGGLFTDLTDLVSNLSDDRVGICIDTTHGWSSGYDIEQICNQIGHDEVRLVHFNQPDPGVEQGSKKDRHASTFTNGRLPLKDLATLYTASRHLPMILEGTPSLTQDAIWMLTWETQIRQNGHVDQPRTTAEMGDIFSLGD